MRKTGYLFPMLTLAGMLVLLAPSMAALAQTPTPEPPLTSTPVAEHAVTFAQLGASDIVLRLDVSDIGQIDFTLPADWIPANTSHVDLNLSYLSFENAGGTGTPPASPKQPLLQVSLNDIEIGTVNLNQLPPDGIVHLNIPPSAWDQALPGQPNRLIFRTHFSGVECGAPSQVVIRATSDLGIDLSSFKDLTYDLANYPQFLISDSLLETRLVFVLPDHPTAEDLQAASVIATRLGQFGQASSAVDATTVTDFPTRFVANSHIIAIGTPESNSLIADIPGAPAGNLPPDTGLIQLFPSPYNPNRVLFVVSGQNQTGIMLAATALSTEVQSPVLAGDRIIVTDITPQASSRPSEQPILFQDLGYSDQTRGGADIVTLNYIFDVAGGYRLAEGSYVDLKFAHSEPLAANASLTVFLNNVAVASTQLDATNSSDGQLKFNIPAGMTIWPTDNVLRVRAELLQAGECKGSSKTSSQSPWITTYNVSSINMTSIPGSFRPITLNDFPNPFSGQRNPGELQIVMPTVPSPADLTALLEVSTELAPRGKIDVWMPDVLQGEMGKSSPYRIVIGTPSSNPALASLNDQLLQPFEAGKDTLDQSHNHLAYVIPPNKPLGLIQLLVPQTSDGTVTLVITGTNETSVFWAGRALSDYLNVRANVDGNLVFVDDVTASAFQVATAGRNDFPQITDVPPTPDGVGNTATPSAQTTNQVNLQGPESQGGQPPLTLAVIGVVGVVILAGAVMILMMRRRI